MQEIEKINDVVIEIAKILILDWCIKLTVTDLKWVLADDKNVV